MPEPTTFAPVPLAGHLQGAATSPFTTAYPVPPVGRALPDFRHVTAATGVITDRVMFKATPSSPESPFANGRIWLLRLVDGYKAWEGWSDSQGNYTARGLEIGVAYIVVGIDPYSEHKATGAGPVVAAAGAA